MGGGGGRGSGTWASKGGASSLDASQVAPSGLSGMWQRMAGPCGWRAWVKRLSVLAMMTIGLAGAFEFLNTSEPKGVLVSPAWRDKGRAGRISWRTHMASSIVHTQPGGGMSAYALPCQTISMPGRSFSKMRRSCDTTEGKGEYLGEGRGSVQAAHRDIFLADWDQHQDQD